MADNSTVCGAMSDSSLMTIESILHRTYSQCTHRQSAGTAQQASCPTPLPATVSEMLESWHRAPARAKLYNVLYGMLTLMAWISCLVAFSGELFYCQLVDDPVTSPAQPTYHFYYDRVESIIGHQSFGDMNRMLGAVNGCTAGGRILVAFDTLTFVSLTVTLALTALRVIAVQLPRLPHPRHSLLIETLSLVIGLVCSFVGLAAYGAKCYHDFQASDKFADVRATGYAFVIVAFFLLLLTMGLLLLIRKDSACWLGAGVDGGFNQTAVYSEDLSGFDQSTASDEQAGSGEGVSVVERTVTVPVSKPAVAVKKSRSSKPKLTEQYGGYQSSAYETVDT